ncbi:MAG TPA: nucleoside-triphosphatase [Geobacteraceae bacterium]|nr:nucleoside-triphosphatase [Geobacteraceae bacterium]
MHPAQPSIAILTGQLHSGKTTLLFQLVRNLRREGIRVCGILAEGLWHNGIRSGFNLIDASDDTLTPLCRRRNDDDPRQATPYIFNEEGMTAGKRALSLERCADADVILVDEVGPLEIRGMGWALHLAPLLRLNGPVHLWVVRNTCLEQVRDRWKLEHAEIIDASETSALSQLTGFCLKHGKKGKDMQHD